MDKSFEQLHYERPDLWDDAVWQSAELANRRSEIAAQLIPVDVHSILDAGSGSGIFEKNAHDRHRTIAFDRSLTALRHIDALRCQGDISKMPFPDNSFDAVLSMEVIEHLPHRNFKPALCEIARLARRYILITVPYCEDLRERQVICPECLCQFHRYFHQRSFDGKKLASLFAPWSPFKCVLMKGICKVETRRLERLWGILIHIYRRKEKFFPWNASCPQCGYQGDNTQSESISLQSTRGTSRPRNWIKSYWPMKSSFVWWLALYEKREWN